MKLWLPFDIDSFASAPHAAIDADAVRQALEEAQAAAALATEAADKAFEQEERARKAQARIHAHNREIAGKFFGKPSNWRKLGQYMGYTALDHEGDLVPHGDGESRFQSGNYHCGEFHMLQTKGLSYWRFANGCERVGWFDSAANIGHCVDRMPEGQVTAGEFAPGGMGYTQKLGLIQFLDGSRFWGFCDFTPEADYWAPSGFGVWDSGRSMACLGYFEDGWISGECAISTRDGHFAALVEGGRAIGRSTDSMA